MDRKAKDVMQSRVVKVGVDDPLLSVHRLFVDEEISGAPVVNEQGDVVGVLTIRDLLRDQRDEEELAMGELEYYRDGVNLERLGSPDHQQEAVESLTSRTASDVMTGNVIAVAPDAPIREIVELVLVNRIHRVLVLDSTEGGSSLVGIISLFDLVELLD